VPSTSGLATRASRCRPGAPCYQRVCPHSVLSPKGEPRPHRRRSRMAFRGRRRGVETSHRGRRLNHGACHVERPNNMGLCNADRCNNFGFDVDAGLGARRDYFDTLGAGRRARLTGATKAGTRRPPTSHICRPLCDPVRWRGRRCVRYFGYTARLGGGANADMTRDQSCAKLIIRGGGRP
jgi:hypothetical protein